MSVTGTGSRQRVWDVVLPHGAPVSPGVQMAGFTDRAGAAVDHRAIPHPGVTFMVEFGSGPPRVSSPRGDEIEGSLVAGLGGLGAPGGALRVRGRGVACIQVRLSPLVAGEALGIPSSSLVGSVVALEDVWGSRVTRRLRERLADATDWADRFAITGSLLASSTARPPVEPEVSWTWHRITSARGRVRIAALADSVGWSRRQLWSRFTAQIGMPPKQAARLARFDHAARRLAAGEDIARVAIECGYADQPHLHREVVAHAGVTPYALAREHWFTVEELAWPTDHRLPRSRGSARVGSGQSVSG